MNTPRDTVSTIAPAALTTYTWTTSERYRREKEMLVWRKLTGAVDPFGVRTVQVPPSRGLILDGKGLGLPAISGVVTLRCWMRKKAATVTSASSAKAMTGRRLIGETRTHSGR